MIGGLGARVFEFTSMEAVGARNDSVGGWNSYGYHVAAVQLGFGLPWLGIAAHHLPAPAQQLYPGRRGQPLATPDRRINRGYRLHADDPAAAAAVLAGPLNEWLPGILSLRIDGRALTCLEVSGGWALAAVQAPGPGDAGCRGVEPAGTAGPPGAVAGRTARAARRVPRAGATRGAPGSRPHRMRTVRRDHRLRRGRPGQAVGCW